jgi:hypothetical protein
MSFGESMFLAGFIQKTKLNHVYPWRKQLQKVPEDTGRHSTEAGPKRMPGGAGWSHLQANQPPLRRRFLHHLLVCIYVVYSSRFDPRAQN